MDYPAFVSYRLRANYMDWELILYTNLKVNLHELLFDLLSERSTLPLYLLPVNQF